MWVLRPYSSPKPLSVDLPWKLTQTLGFGVDFLVDYLEEISDSVINDKETLPTPPTALCRICEHYFPTWWFERHSELCLVGHKAQSDIETAHENLLDQRHTISQLLNLMGQKFMVLASSTSNSSPSTSGSASEMSAALNASSSNGTPPSSFSSSSSMASINSASSSTSQKKIEYRGHQLPISAEIFAISSTSSPPPSPRIPNSTRARAIGKPLNKLNRQPVKLLELLIGLCDLAIQINYPEIKTYPVSEDNNSSKKTKSNPTSTLGKIQNNNDCHQEEEQQQEVEEEEEEEEAVGSNIRLHSPHSESNISSILKWTSPNVQDPGLALLCQDTEKYAKEKVDAVLRLGNTLKYSDTVRREVESMVFEVVEDTIAKAHQTKLDCSQEDSDQQIENTNEDEKKYYDVEDDDTDLDSSSFFSENYLNTDAIPLSTSSPTISRRSNLVMNLNTEMDSKLPQDALDEGVHPKSTASEEVLITPKSILSNSGYSQVPAGERKLKTGLSLKISRRSTLDLPLDSSLEELDLSNPIQIPQNKLHPRKSVSSLSMNSPSSYSSSYSSMHRNRITTNNSIDINTNLNSPSTPLSSPLLFPHEHGSESQLSTASTNQSTASNSNSITGSNVLLRRQSSIIPELSRPPVSPLLSTTVPLVKPSQPSIKDYEIINPISRGAFGNVFLARKKLTGDYYAIKVLKKADMIAKNQVMNVRAERAIMMSQSESPFVAKLYYTFQSKNYLYLVMEYLNGGDCAALIKALGGLTEQWAQRYCAEVVVGVQDLHEKGIVHRDLKPDNLLIDKNGHLKLTDFGLSRMGLVRRHTRQSFSYSEAGNSNDMPPPSSASAVSIPPPSMTSSSLGSGFSRLESKPLMKANTTPEPTTHRQSSSSSSTSNSVIENLLQDSNISLVPGYFNINSSNTTGSSTASSSSLKYRPSLTRSESNNSTTGEALFIGSMLFGGGDRFPLDEDRESAASSSGSSENGSPRTSTITHNNSSINNPLYNQASFSRNNSTSSSSNSPKPLALFDPASSAVKFVGTPDYLAPETIKGVGQDEMSDWWSLGCILFEFLYGYPPFHAETPELVFQNILNHNIQWPSPEDEAECEIQISDNAKDLINKLLNPDPNSRIGAQSGAEEIKLHPFFDGINWETLWEENPSFVPSVDDPESTDYFDPRGAETQDVPEDMIESDDDDQEDDENSGQLSKDDLAGNNENYQSTISDNSSSGRSSRADSFETGAFPFPLRDLNRPKPYPSPIPAHIRDNRSRRLSEPTNDDFGSFAFKNLPVLDKANKEYLDKIKTESLEHRNSDTGRRTRGLSISAVPPKRPISPSINTAIPTGSGSRLPSPVRQLSSSSSNSVQYSTTLNSPLSSSSNFSPSSPSSSTTSQSGLNSCFSPRKSISTKQRSSIAVPSSSPINCTPMSPKQSSYIPISADLSTSKGSVFIPNNRESSPELSTQPQRKHSIVRYAQTFDPSPSSSDNEDSLRNTALFRVQKRRQISQRSQSRNTQIPSYRPLDVLLCDENPVVRYTSSKLLRELGCRVVAVSCTPEAIRCATGSVKFDVIFTEYRFEKTTGADLARMIRNTNSLNTNCPIVVVTSHLKEAEASSQSKQYFSAILEKPPTSASFCKALEQCCFWRPKSASMTLAMSPLSTNSPGFLGNKASPSSSVLPKESSSPGSLSKNPLDNYSNEQTSRPLPRQRLNSNNEDHKPTTISSENQS